MPVKMHFNWKDIPRAARFGFSAKKIWVMVEGLFISSIIYAILSYIALLVSGDGLAEIWRSYRFIPTPSISELSILGAIIQYIAIFIFVLINFFYGVAVSKITFEQLKGDEFYEISKARKFAFTTGKAVLWTPISIILIILAILALGVIVGLIGKIPYFGELFLLLSSVPAFFGVLLIVYLVVALVLSLFISAAIIGATKSDTFDTLFEVFSTLNEQNWRFLGYEALLFGVILVAGAIWIFAIGRALYIAHAVLGAGWLMGQKYITLEKIAHYYLSVPSFMRELPVFRWFANLTAVSSILNPPYSLPDANIVMQIVGFIFGILLYATVFMGFGYMLSMFWVGNLLGYVVITLKKDDLNLLEQKEEEIEEVTTESVEGEKEEEEKQTEEKQEKE